MSNYELEECKLLKYQIYLSIIFLFTIVISITLSYNAIMRISGKERLYTDNEEINILKFNRMIASLVALCFLLINIYDKSLKEGHDRKNADMQIIASIFTLISSLIVLYVAFNGGSSLDDENPEI